jgi:Esterase/lipase
MPTRCFRKFLCCILLGFGSLAAFPLFGQTLRLWDDSLITDKRMHYAEMSVFCPEHNAEGVAVIICPGGSYQHLLGIDREGYRVAKWLNEQGITAFVLRYRIGWYGNRHPAMIQDLQRAIQLVKSQSEVYDIVPEKLGVLGFSAGGHLVGMAATYFDTNFMSSLGVEPEVSLRPAFVGMIYPVVSMTDSLAHKRSRRNLLSKSPSSELIQQFSLEQNVRVDMPPVFLVQCRGDATVDYRNSQYYHIALAERGVPHEYLLFEENGHGFGIEKGKGSKEAWQWGDAFLSWLRNTRAEGGE